MVMGGIPYYLSMMDKSKSLAQNIDQLFFADNAELKDEFNDLYRALFKKSADHIAVVTALATKGMGMTRQELVKASEEKIMEPSLQYWKNWNNADSSVCMNHSVQPIR